MPRLQPCCAQAATLCAQVPKLAKTCRHDQSTGFILRHFAGDVTYSGGHFLETNNDTLHSSRFLTKVTGVVHHTIHYLMQAAMQETKRKNACITRCSM